MAPQPFRCREDLPSAKDTDADEEALRVSNSGAGHQPGTRSEPPKDGLLEGEEAFVHRNCQQESEVV
jgi:hypothetical protein